jgi:hypothetical protein
MARPFESLVAPFGVTGDDCVRKKLILVGTVRRRRATVIASAVREAALLHPVIRRIEQFGSISPRVRVAYKAAIKLVARDLILCDRRDVVRIPSKIGIDQIDGLVEHLEIDIEIEGLRTA